MVSFLLMLLALLLAAVLVVTGGRFLLLLVGANGDSELVQRIYDWSEFWVEPFFRVFGLDNKAVEDTGGVFEPASLIAFCTYLVIGVLVIGFVSSAASRRLRHA